MEFELINEPKPKGRSKYPFIQMKVNDTFIVETDKRANISSICKYWSSKLKRKFTTSKVESGIKVRRDK